MFTSRREISRTVVPPTAIPPLRLAKTEVVIAAVEIPPDKVASSEAPMVVMFCSALPISRGLDVSEALGQPAVDVGRVERLVEVPQGLANLVDLQIGHGQAALRDPSLTSSLAGALLRSRPSTSFTNP